jgi:hypothetical protein
MSAAGQMQVNKHRQMKMGDFILRWTEGTNEYHIFHWHSTKENEHGRYSYCIKNEKSKKIEYECRKCNTPVPGGLVYAALSRRMSDG